jgi:hypothetical protein
MRGSFAIAQLQSAFDGTWKIDMNKVDFFQETGRPGDGTRGFPLRDYL